MDSIEDRFLEVIKETYEEYKASGPRSTRKLKILHGWIQDELRDRLGHEYQIYGLSKDSNSEKKVTGRYYNKNVDISIEKNGKTLGVVSIKFVLSSLQKNTTNYFEGQMGETANLRSGDIVFGHIFCVLQPIPVRRTGEDIVNWEYVNDSFMDKYRKLAEDKKHQHAPDVQAICIFKRDTDKNAVMGWCEQNDFEEISKLNYDYLMNNMGIDRFFEIYIPAIVKKTNN